MPESIYQRLALSAYEKCGSHVVLDCAVNTRCLGVHTTAGTGLAFVPGDAWALAKERGVARVEDSLRGIPLTRVISWYEQSDPLHAVLALAVINALHIGQGREDHSLWPDRIGNVERLGLVGDLRPFVNRIGFADHERLVFELRPVPGAYAPEDAPRLLPSCDLVFITSAVFSNRTVHQYLPYVGGQAKAFIFGHGTPLADCLLDRFTLGSNEVIAPEEAFRKLREGWPIRKLKPFMRKIIRYRLDGLHCPPDPAETAHTAAIPPGEIAATLGSVSFEGNSLPGKGL